MNSLNTLALSLYRFKQKAEAKLFAITAKGVFDEFGKDSVLMLPVRLSGERRIAIGDNVYIGAGSWLQTLPDGENRSPSLRIGSRTSMAGYCVLSAVRSVVLEDDVLLARNVYISDHIHKYTDREIPIKNQGVDKVEPVLICKGAWLGQNVVICPGVRIGRNAVVGANSVVNSDVPDYSIAVGAPARVVKNIAESS
jgi:acetyltransferase-like isoleucine patch superfamily enzyme